MFDLKKEFIKFCVFHKEDWQNGNAAVLKTVALWAWGFESSILRQKHNFKERWPSG